MYICMDLANSAFNCFQFLQIINIFCEMDFFSGKRICKVSDLISETTKPHRDSFPVDDSN